MGNEVVKKDILAQYVHDAVEMEAAIFTLDSMEKECDVKKKKSIISSVVIPMKSFLKALKFWKNTRMTREWVLFKVLNNSFALTTPSSRFTGRGAG